MVARLALTHQVIHQVPPCWTVDLRCPKQYRLPPVAPVHQARHPELNPVVLQLRPLLLFLGMADLDQDLASVGLKCSEWKELSSSPCVTTIWEHDIFS